MSWRRIHRELKEVQPTCEGDRPGPSLVDKVVDNSFERRKQYQANYDERFNHQPFRKVKHKRIPVYRRYPRIIAISALGFCLGSLYWPFIRGRWNLDRNNLTPEQQRQSDLLAKIASEKLWMFSPKTYSVKRWFEKDPSKGFEE
eukprot:TCALIF_05681-PA protein Name:"Protein of unknown function" AED:0.98 eAED:1.00 QI:0/-1/0/1/-1/1/1/0/143